MNRPTADTYEGQEDPAQRRCGEPMPDEGPHPLLTALGIIVFGISSLIVATGTAYVVGHLIVWLSTGVKPHG